MTSFHPTISPLAWLRYLITTSSPTAVATQLSERFPDHQTVLTDSGRSAIAVVIETLELQGKTILLPAFVCDSYYPILRAYNITPHFVDVAATTYQPPLESYTDELLARVDAVVLVATYGAPIDATVLNHLKKRNVILIEDFAMRSPLFTDPLIGDARIYSLPKTLPVPDGGLAVLPKTVTTPSLEPHQRSLGFYKNVLKLLPVIGLLIATIRDLKASIPAEPSWNGIQKPSALTITILADYLATTVTSSWLPFPYCFPLHVADPEVAQKALRRAGISAERIWGWPIVLHETSQTTYQVAVADFPVTTTLAQGVVCVPLWHIETQEHYEQYLARLQQILPDGFGEQRIER